jgi:hypothetical protein
LSTESRVDPYKAWMDYIQTVNEESATFFQRSMDMSRSLFPMANQDFMRLWMENYQEFVTRMTENPTAFQEDPAGAARKLYDTWVDIWSKNLETYLRSPEFAAKSGRDLEMFSEMRKRWGQFLESYWEGLHLPSSADMRELYQKMYTMDRKLDDIDSRLRKLALAEKK